MRLSRWEIVRETESGREVFVYFLSEKDKEEEEEERKKDRERERERERVRVTDGQISRQIGRETERQRDRCTNIKRHRKEIERYRQRQ